MKKTTFTTALLGLMFSCSSMWAQSVKSFPAYAAPKAELKAPQAGIPAPDNRDLGQLMYASTLKDALGPHHIVSFRSKNASEPNRLMRVEPNDDGFHMRNFRCGAWIGDKYVGYMVNIYTYMELPRFWVEVDLKNGTLNELYDFKDEQSGWPTIYEMTYSNAAESLYGIAQHVATNEAGDVVGYFSAIYDIDPTNGAYTKIWEHDAYIFAAACDYEGYLYTIEGVPDEDGMYAQTCLKKLDPANNFAVLDRKIIKVDGMDFAPNYTHTMDMDHNSNQLFWVAQDNSGYQKLVKIDPKTGETEVLSQASFNTYAALYVPYQGAANRDAAGKVTNITASPDNNLALNDTLKWVNPTVNWRGDNLSELHSIRISRGTMDNVIKTLPATNMMGQAMSYVDNAAEEGINTYYLTAFRKDGEIGLTDSVKVYVGADIPGAVSNIKLTPSADFSKVELSWTDPEIGAHGRKYDKNSLTYNIVRYPDNVTVVTGHKGNTFTDNSVLPYNKYSYEITAFTNKGEGVTVMSESQMFGTPYTAPYAVEFTSTKEADLWSVDDADLSGKSFEYSELFKRFTCFTSNGGNNNDYLVSPPLKLKAGTYRINFATQWGDPDEIYTFDIVMGKGKTASELTTEVAKFEWKLGPSQDYISPINEGKATVYEDGVYYVALHNRSEISFEGGYFAALGFSIDPVYTKDLGADGFGENPELAQNTECKLNVKVTNYGTEAQNAYKVKVIDATDGSNNIVGEATGTATIEPDMTVDVPVMINCPTIGKRSLIAVVEMTGDERAENDRSAAIEVNVVPEGNAIWNTYIDEPATGAQHTTIPMSFMNKCSTVETIYLGSEIKCESPKARIERIAFVYSSNDELTETSEEFDVTVYAGMTDASQYGAQVNGHSLTPKEQLTLAYKGKHVIEVGQDKLMVLDFQTPVYYEQGKNLAIQVWKNGSTSSEFPALFKTFGYGSSTPRSMRYHGIMDFNFDPTQSFLPIYQVPVIHMAIGDNVTGITENVVLGGKFFYNEAKSSIVLNGFAAKNLNIYSVSGQLVSSHVINGQNEVAVNLIPGVYVVKAMNENGQTQTQKIVVNK